MPSEHSSLVGGSSAPLRLKCPASLKETKDLPKEPWNQYAARGTALHTITEISIKDWLSDDAILEKYVGEELENIRITRELIENKVFPALDFFEVQIPEDYTIHLEQKVNLFDTIKDAFGTADLIFSSKKDKRAGIIDWKFGDNHIVKAKDNDSARFYLACAYLNGFLPKLKHYEFWIFQPSSKLSPNEYASVGYYTYEELMDFVDDLADAIENALSDNPTYVTGEHCRYCKGKMKCHAYNDMLRGVSVTDIPDMNGDDLSHWKKQVPALKALISEIEQAALRNALNGVYIPGYKLEDSHGHTKWKNEESASNALARIGIAHKDRIDKTLKSPTQIKQIMKEKGITKEDIQSLMKRHSKRPFIGEKLIECDDVEDDLTRLGKSLAAV